MSEPQETAQQNYFKGHFVKIKNIDCGIIFFSVVFKIKLSYLARQDTTHVLVSVRKKERLQSGSECK